ncbi:MAG: TonB family protein [Gemmatimonadaceae bacterium]
MPLPFRVRLFALSAFTLALACHGTGHPGQPAQPGSEMFDVRVLPGGDLQVMLRPEEDGAAVRANPERAMLWADAAARVLPLAVGDPRAISGPIFPALPGVDGGRMSLMRQVSGAGVRLVLLAYEPARGLDSLVLSPDDARLLLREIRKGAMFVRYAGPPPSRPTGPVFDFQVEKPAVLAPGQGLPEDAYPDSLHEAGVPGKVIVKVRVKTNGSPDMTTFTVIESSHHLFTEVVRRAVSGFRFLPAEVGDRKIEMWVQMPFEFTIDAPAGDSASAGASDDEFIFGLDTFPDRPARLAPGEGLPVHAYPDTLRKARVEGVVLAQFVVDTMGRAEMSTFRIVESDHHLFSWAVRRYLSRMHYIPAEDAGRKVRMWVQQPFTFAISR